MHFLKDSVDAVTLVTSHVFLISKKLTFSYVSHSSPTPQQLYRTLYCAFYLYILCVVSHSWLYSSFLPSFFSLPHFPFFPSHYTVLYHMYMLDIFF